MKVCKAQIVGKRKVEYTRKSDNVQISGFEYYFTHAMSDVDGLRTGSAFINMKDDPNKKLGDTVQVVLDEFRRRYEIVQA